MPNDFPVKLINLDASWDFRNLLLTEGLDLFGQGSGSGLHGSTGIDVGDYTGDQKTSGASDLAMVLSPWADVRTKAELPSALGQIALTLVG